MNRLEANISLLAITFFAALQYVFLQAVPSDVSNFAFLFVTNLIGFIFSLFFFFGELFRIDRQQVFFSILLAAELFCFNLLLLMGSREMDATAVAGIAAIYFIFIPIILIIRHRKVGKDCVQGTVLVLLGVLMTLEFNTGSILNVHVIYLILADICVAAYLLTVERFCQRSNPAILAMGQMLFGSIFAFAAWCAESALGGTRMSLPLQPAFWSSVFFISFFIRGLYGVVQIYAQRYVSALNTSLIFSTEVIITLFLSPLLAQQLGVKAEPVTLLKVFGCLLIAAGVLTADGLPKRLMTLYYGGSKSGRKKV
ncbi:MAG: DMT family transporter [Lachnospiraceae bacterium]|jgi:drug/metabolite transporter (DMT)-like permease|nr:DMT family transporter [Lachnospiraceae bacterium]